MKLPALASALLLPVLLGSCIVSLGSDGHSTSYIRRSGSSAQANKSPADVAYDNRKNLACLSVGMTLPEVLDVMQEETWGTSSSSRLTNPHKRDSFPMDGGGQADVLYFYSDTRTEDGLVTEDELTPVYFENGQLVGWGSFGFETWRSRVLGL